MLVKDRAGGRCQIEGFNHVNFYLAVSHSGIATGRIK